ncbi:YcaO-like family protein [Streptomyces sp. NPDC040724]|uniref:YcaO-like family protein n=1 Tax=unclassified Streptomyces TaxID=2593676 RepID=UPI0033E875AB
MTAFSERLTAGLHGLVSPYGVVSEVRTAQSPRGFSGISLASARVGGAPGIERPKEFQGSGRSVQGSGTARLIAVAEAAERYAGADFPLAPEVWATEGELDGPVLDMKAIARCSSREYESGQCPVVPYGPEDRIRWARGVDLASGETTWVPAVMARHGIRDLAPAERFWNRISTGYATHSDPAEAVLRGICEVAERDAAALTWLQMLPLPRISFDSPAGPLRELLEASARHFITTHFFDATTDIGVPTVYCVQIAEYDEACRQLVSCSTGRDLAEAATKTLMESIPGRSLFHRQDRQSYALIMAGATLMGHPAQQRAFDFLLAGTRSGTGHGADGAPDLPARSTEALAQLVRRLTDHGMQAVAVDRTTRELEAAGLTAVCVVIPALQPLTFHRYGQYRAHPRLYTAPELMGFTSHPEEELNPWPQPFL